MTTYVNIRVSCPSCSTELRDQVRASGNNFCHVQWSDGYWTSRLDRAQSTLRKCCCGYLFVPARFVVMTEKSPDFSDFFESEAFTGRRKRQWPWSAWFRGRISRVESRRAELEPAADTPTAQMLDAQDFEAALGALHDFDQETEAEVRLWCFWNRNRVRAANGDGASRADDDNTIRLVDMLCQRSRPNTLVLGQGLRDLGLFDEAGALYGDLAEGFPWKAQLLGLADKRSSEVVTLVQGGEGA